MDVDAVSPVAPVAPEWRRELDKRPLNGLRVMVVEDEYLLADDLAFSLSSIGATVLGPVATVQEATALIDGDAAFDVAILDVNLRGDMVFPVADALIERGIPFAFATGYDRWTLPARFVERPWIDKPSTGEQIAATLGALVKPVASA